MSDDPRRQELGSFLRTRRLRLSPKEAGLQHAEFTRRRTKGLRREEVAALAGISLPWYTSLEQGRDINVSEQVLDSLCRVLRLDQDERNHLYFLSNSRQTAFLPREKEPVISPSLTYLLDQMPLCPAYVTDAKMNVLAWNHLAVSVFGSFGAVDSSERNMIWRMFMLPAYRTLFADWDDLAASLLGHFRVMYGQHLDDLWYAEFIASMTENSPEFATMWESYDVRCTNQYPQVITHPQAGRLNLSTLVFPIQYRSGQFLHTYTPDLQDGSVERLAKLAQATPISH
ncbi:helix-turn-helix transcriptional regulator [Paenibacillus dauci]|uniref:helix-turn-helix transcriptional regulator n=1 Tax=Paenibacillus dauci TaxID=1567106 RepID=UPI00061A09E6|nr:helix-turn-helix transcriptional regulator [Paenibacillus dauci]